jgi:hypothetical protein
MVGRLLRIRTGKHPHEIFVIVATVALGIVGVIVPEEISSAIASEFAWPWAVVYWACMVVFGATTLYGIFMHKIEGLLIERAGLVMVAVLYGIFIFAVASYAGWNGLVSMTLPAAFASANIARCCQIGTDLALLKAYLKDHPGDEVR